MRIFRRGPGLGRRPAWLAVWIVLRVGWAVVAVAAATVVGSPPPSAPGSSPAVGPGNVPVELTPRWRQVDETWTVDWSFGEEPLAIGDPTAPAGLEIRAGDDPDFRAVRFADRRPLEGRSGVGSGWEFGPASMGSVTVRLEETRLGPELWRRTLVVTAAVPTRFAARWSVRCAGEDTELASFSRAATNRVVYDTMGGGPEYPQVAGETFPVALGRRAGRVLGVLADSPGRWENRCLVELDPPTRRLAVMCGDGRPAAELRVRYDARDTYVCAFDGWQSLKAGETRRYDTWVFCSRASSRYDAQLAAHLALANAKGWNRSALEAMLRNTAYLLLRRNLMRTDPTEGRYIFTSGIGYGWKQWVSDGFWQAVALGDTNLLYESHRGVFLNRITYEDNAQYYLVWAALVRRSGQTPNPDLVRAAFEFIRRHEKEGIYYPPGGLNPERPRGFKTYHDLLEYDDDDAPVSNQGFHCGALLAARELGLPVTDADVRRSIKAYQRMFQVDGGYFPTSIKQPKLVGQDTLYGAALTFAVFGERLLPDEFVEKHWRTSQRIATRFGLRVISQADGSLLPGHSGEYVFGGSWFLNDAANHLMAGLHGVPAVDADGAIVRRLGAELAVVPAFNESISTVTGKPHGHILYSWNSGYWWLRQQFRERLKRVGPDPVDLALDVRLGVLRDARGLRLEPGLASLRPGR